MAKDQIIEIDAPSLEKIQRQLGNMSHKAPTVMSRAINKTITDVSSFMAKEAQKRYWVKIGAVKKTLRIRRSYATKPEGEVISVSGDKVKLYGFKVKPNKPMPSSPPAFFTAQVKKGTGLKALTGSADRSAAFVAIMSSGHIGVFQRQLNNGSPKQDTKRTQSRAQSKFHNMPDHPIAELTGPSIPSMFSTKRMSKEIIDHGRDFMYKAVDAEIKRMQRAGK